MRLAMREWPASERCLARESSSLRLARGRVQASAPSARADRAKVSSMVLPEVDHACLPATIDKLMNIQALRRFVQQEDLNFLLTNRVPRIALTRLMVRFSRIESPWLARLSIAVWRLFTDLDLSDAKLQRFKSLHDCFTRELVPGARTIDLDPSVFTSPCDAIVRS